MNTPAARFNLRLAATTLEKNRNVAQLVRANDASDDTHRYEADRLEELSEACLMGAVYDYLLALSDAIEVRELRKP